MGCVLSSERGADDFGADSRTMLARPKVRVASPPPDGRSLGTRHVTAALFRQRVCLFRSAPPASRRLRPERAYRAVVERGSERHAPSSLCRSRPLTFASRRSRTQPRVLGVIPARYDSRRFAGKPLALLGGKPLVMHVYRNACKAKCLDACVVATDDDRIAKAVRDNGGEVIMTDAACETSPERCLEVVRELRRRRADGKKGTTWTAAAAGEFDVVVCIDADEPFVQPHHIETVADLVVNSDADVGTLVRPSLDEDDVASADTVKVVTDDRDYALLFSHEPVPKRRGEESPMIGVARSAYDPEVAYKVRVGIQAFGTDFLEKYASLLGRRRIEPDRVADKENASPRTKKNGKVLEASRSLSKHPEPSDEPEPEQNPVVFAGYKVKVDVVESTFVRGVKTPEDLRHLNAGLAAGLVNDLQLTFLAA